MKASFALPLLFNLFAASGALAHPIAKIKTYGGYTLQPYTYEITVDSDGTVTAENTVGDYANPATSIVTNALIATLNPAIVKAIQDSIASAQTQELVPKNPEAPACVDAPITEYWAMNSARKPTTLLAKVENCQDYILNGYQGLQAIDLLKSLKALSIPVR